MNDGRRGSSLTGATVKTLRTGVDLEPISVAEMRKQVAVLSVAERIFDAAVLFGLFDLGVFGVLASGPKNMEELRRTIQGDEDSLRASLDAAVALGILSKNNEDRYLAGEDLLDCLGRRQSPAFVGEWIAFLNSLAEPVLNLPEAVRNGATSFGEVGAGEARAQEMTRAMDAYARARGVEIVRHLDFSKAGTMLDLACGPGTYSMAIAERYPELRITLLDLPGPVEEARRIAAERGMEDRFSFVAADAFSFAPREPFDLVLISNTLQMLGPVASKALLRRCFQMVNPGGHLVVQGMYLNSDRTSPRWPALLNLVMRVATPNGRNHTVEETIEWLDQAGFVETEHVAFSLWNVCSCVVGRRVA